MPLILDTESHILLEAPSGSGKTALIASGVGKALEQAKMNELDAVQVMVVPTCASTSPVDFPELLTSNLDCR